MQIQGNLEVLRDLARGSDHKRVIYAGPGGMRGASAGAIVSELEALGLTARFEAGIGGSTGACAIAYFIAGQAALGNSIYAEECTTRDFISYRRLLRGEPMMGLDYITDVFRNSPTKALDQEALRRSPTAFYVTATNAETGAGAFLNAKESDQDILYAGRVSMAVPASSKPILMNGTWWYDGSVGYPFPARELVRRFPGHDLVILANRTRAYREDGGVLRRLLNAKMIRHASPALQEANARRGEVFAEELRYLESQRESRYVIFWGDPRLHVLTRDASLIKKVSAETRAQVKECFLTSLAL